MNIKTVKAVPVDPKSVPADAPRVTSTNVPAGQVWFSRDTGVFYVGP